MKNDLTLSQAIKQNTNTLRVAANTYAQALHMHCLCASADHQIKAEVNYLTWQADFVRTHAEKYATQLTEAFARDSDQLLIDSMHLQYFFPICPPVYEPYETLWRQVESDLEEAGIVTKPDSICFVTKRRDRRWTLSAKESPRLATQH